MRISCLVLSRVLSAIIWIGLALFFGVARSSDYSPLWPGPVDATVAWVVDGDTIDVTSSAVRLERVRFLDVDTPELHARCDAEAAGAQAAKTAVASLIGTRPVTLSEIRRDHDRYGRTLARVTTSDGIDVSEFLVSSGLGRRYGGGKRDGWCSAK
jgi:endonuclease YncB( thermonuclease family)